jgi:hypothetical protein
MQGKTYELDESTVTFAEGEAVETVTGMPFVGMGFAILLGHLLPQRAMAWITIKREQPELKFEDTASWPIESIEWSFEEDSKEADTKKGQGKRKKKASPI